MLVDGTFPDLCSARWGGVNTADWGNDYAPTPYDKPITIKVAWHFAQSIDLVNNFTATDDGIDGGDGIPSFQGMTGDSLARWATAKMNERIATGNQSFTIAEALNQNLEVLPFNVRFEVVSIDYPQLTDTISPCDSQIQEYYPGALLTDDAMHVLVHSSGTTIDSIPFYEWETLEDTCVGPAYFQEIDNCGFTGSASYGTNRVNIHNFWYHYKYFAAQTQNYSDCGSMQSTSPEDWLEWRVSELATLLWHEIGHALRLRHVYHHGQGYITISNGALVWNPPFSNYLLDSLITDFCSDTPTPDTVLTVFNGFHPQDGDTSGGYDCSACWSTYTDNQPNDDPPLEYVCSNNLMDYCRDTDYGVSLTPQQLGRMFRSVYEEQFDIIKQDYCEVDTACNLVINPFETVEWRSAKIVRGNLIIRSNAELTVRNHVYMPLDGRVIVEPGGKLIVEEGCFTTKCDGLWIGIEVWGDASQPQIASQQGTLELKDAVIENAHTGIWVRENDELCDYVQGSGGGIVHAESSTIRNCYIGAEYAPYHWTNAFGDSTRNVGYFEDVTFIQTRPLNGDILFKSHIILNEIVKIPFRGCTFTDMVANDSTYQSYYGDDGIENMGTGIDARTSSFEVRQWCSGTPGTDGTCSGGSWQSSVFSNLRFGIHASDEFGTSSFKVNDATFEGNAIGILAEGIYNGPSIMYNTFELKPLPVNNTGLNQGWTLAGVQMEETQGFEIEENTFLGLPNGDIGNEQLIGAAFVDTDTLVANECYLNTFDALYAGAFAQGRNGGFNDGPLPGLQFICNTFGSNVDNSFGDIVLANNAAVNVEQGVPQTDAVAGNKFSHLCPGMNEPSDIVLGIDALGIAYYFGDESPDEEPICKSDLVNNILDEQSENPCLPDGSLTHSKQELLNEIDDLEDILADTEAIYRGLLDCGNRQVAVDAVNDPSLSSLEVRNALLNCSPYVSDSLFQLTFDRIPALSPWHMAQVLLANSPLSLRVKQMMLNSGLSSYYQQLVLNGQNGGPTHKSILEADMSSLQLKLDRARQDYKRLSYLHGDSLKWDEVIVRLEAEGAPVRAKIGANYFAKETMTADSLMGSLPTSTTKDKALKAITETLLDTAHCPRFTVQQENILRTLAADPTAEGRSMARAALRRTTGEVYQTPLLLPTSKRATRSELLFEEESLFKVVPNPAQNEALVSFAPPGEGVNVVLTVSDMNGRLLKSYNNLNNGYQLLELNDLSSGFYIVLLSFDGVQVSSQKMIVNK